MRECISCKKDLSKLKSAHRKCWHCRTGNRPKRIPKRKYSESMIREAVTQSVSIAGVMRLLEMPSTGYNHNHISRMIKSFEIDIAHFTGKVHNRGLVARNKKSWKDILVERTPLEPRVRRTLLLRSMLEYGFKYECAECLSPPIWYGTVLVLEIDHCNGHFWDNRPNNLRFLCPNCHSQQTTNKPFKYRNGVC